MNNAALNARIESVLSAFRASKQPETVAHIQDQLGWRFQPVWEVEQLLSKGLIVRVQNTPGVHCVDGRYKVASLYK